MRPGPGRQRRTGAAYTCSFDIQIAAFGDQRHAARQIEQAAVGTGLDPEANAQRTGSKSRRWQGNRGGAVETERSEAHTSEPQSLMRISYAVSCLKKNKQN